jgi:hypothetical protein
VPQIIITTDGPGGASGTEVHRERIHPTDVETDTSSHLLVERIGWALSDASQLEDGSDRSYEEEPAEPFVHRSGSIEDTAVH